MSKRKPTGESPKPTGRPSGAKNITDKAEVIASRCQKCGSTHRSQYQNTQRRDFAKAGTPFSEIIYRRCQCLDCLQWRVDSEKVYPSAEAPAHNESNEVTSEGDDTLAAEDASIPDAAETFDADGLPTNA